MTLYKTVEPSEWPEAHERPHQGRGVSLSSSAPGTLTVSPGPQYPAMSPDYGSITLRREDVDFPSWAESFPLMEVGTGKIKGPYCGTYHAVAGKLVGACKNSPGKHKPALIPNSCKRRECPECWPTWARHAGKRVQQLLNGYMNAKLRGQALIDPDCKPDYLPNHISLHPPRKLIERLLRETKKSLEGPEGIQPAQFWREFQIRYRKEENRILQIAGATGYITIYHDIRLRRDKEDWKADRMQDTNRYRDVLNYPDWRDHVKFSPHSHLQAFGYFMDYEAFYELTGWTYRKHRVITNAETLTYYLLSHAPSIPNVHNIRPCGALNKHRLMVSGTIVLPVFPTCPECIKEGKKAEETGFLLSTLDNVHYSKDARGHHELSDWAFSKISNKAYRQTERIKVYRILKKGERPGRAPVNLFPTIAEHKLNVMTGRALHYLDWEKLPEAERLAHKFVWTFRENDLLTMPDKAKTLITRWV